MRCRITWRATSAFRFGNRSKAWERRAVRLMTLGLLICLSLTASADTLTGKVVKITDGDTLYVLDANYKEHKIPSL